MYKSYWKIELPETLQVIHAVFGRASKFCPQRNDLNVDFLGEEEPP